MKFKSFIAEAPRVPLQKAEAIVVLKEPDSKKKISAHVDYTYTMDPDEYEGGVLFYEGGPQLKTTKVRPFTFQGKSYSSITKELISLIDFHPKFKDKWEDEIESAVEGDKGDQSKVINEYLDFLFYDAVKDEVPDKHQYSRTT